MGKKWLMLFSQSGSEIVSIINHLNKKPDLILSNQKDKSLVHTDIVDSVAYADHNSVMQILRAMDPAVITLHGYLRILPADVCEHHEIYNGHPGLITDYHELKGKDPQIKVWNQVKKYPKIGSVVHKVIPEVDAGNILTSASVNNYIMNQEDIFDVLKMTSLNAWQQFFDQNEDSK